MSYAVYRVAYLGAPRNHHTIFVETGEDGPETGRLFHVNGDIQNGMSFEDKPTRKPDASVSFVSKEHIGSVTHNNYPRVTAICQEWTAEVIEALANAQVLQQP